MYQIGEAATEFSHRLEPEPNRPAVVMAGSGETLTHWRLRARVNKVAHLLRAAGLRHGDHFAIFMENHPRYIECGRAGGRSGLEQTIYVGDGKWDRRASQVLRWRFVGVGNRLCGKMPALAA
jgi:hypothetical protein